jgi:hypothetical protein
LGNNYKYGFTGPPFNFLGHFCDSQYQAFKAWVNARTGQFSVIQQFHQARAAQLRKTAGVLEQFYSKTNDETLKPTFEKSPWKPGPDGWFGYVNRNDQLPMVAVAGVKDHLREWLQRQDEGVFAMNQVRHLIEKTEDRAQAASEANADMPVLFKKIESYFEMPEYAAVLVKDTTDVYPPGSSQPRYRVHQLDAPTQWEKEQSSHQLKQGGSTTNPID